MPYSLRPRVRPTPCSRAGKTVESSVPGMVPKENPTFSHCLVGQTFELEARVKVPEQNPTISHCLVTKARGGIPQPNPLPRTGQPGSIICPHSSASTDVPLQPLPTAQANVAGPFDCQSSDPRALCSTLPASLKQNNTFLNPRDPFYVGAFNVRTLCQIGKQAMVAETLYSLKIDVCCVSETRIQDPSVVMHLKTPRMNSALSHFSLRVSGDPEAMTGGIYGVRVALSPRAERALLDWIPRLCDVRLFSSINLNASRDKKRCLFVYNYKKYGADEHSLAIISALHAIGCDIDFLVHQPVIISYRGICFPQSAKAVIGLGLPKVAVSDLCLLAIVGSLRTYDTFMRGTWR
ncbi:hypothetical protein T265_10339 [Opisthorchis viverrini]|uniref:Uncharacterized protein n=1 Tax=Opisthorchis viverrini TaxID=6198 RepID=A0A074ZDN6_OPIVI|nr:hypothetical protein T265_10339 [Opisthorchis viverrini]KER21310.1 hypothetical protein T265_10339 [Opisthorchis viverrini]